jgi:hypothetical protein
MEKEPVYAFADDGLFEPYGRPAFTLRSGDAGGVAFEFEVTALGF